MIHRVVFIVLLLAKNTNNGGKDKCRYYRDHQKEAAIASISAAKRSSFSVTTSPASCVDSEI